MHFTDNNKVFEQIVSDNGSIIILYEGQTKKIEVSSSKQAIAADGVDKAVITAKLYTWDDKPIDQAIDIVFMLNGEQLPIKTNADGSAIIDFSAETSGSYIISCQADGYDMGQCEVYVNG